MHTLHVRSVPDDLYESLKELAQARQRSLSAQVISLLDRALLEEQRRREQSEVLATVRRRRFTPPLDAPTSVDLLRNDREQ